MGRLRYNLLKATLGSGLSVGATAVTFTAALTYESGRAVPTLASGDYIPFVMIDGTSTLEIVWLTAYTSGDTTGTIARGQEGTTATTHTAGEKMVHSATTKDFDSTTAGNDVLYAPQSGVTTVDEFNDGAIDGAWVRVDAPGGAGRADWVEAGDSLSCFLTGGDASQELHALVRPIGTPMVAGDALIFRCSARQSDGNFATNYTMLGLLLADGNTYGTGSQIIAQVYQGWFQLQPHTSYSVGAGTANQTPINYWDIKVGFWLRVVKMTGNDWRLDISPNGIHWFSLLPYTQSFIPTHIGPFASSWGTPVQAVVTFDLVRRMSGVT